VRVAVRRSSSLVGMSSRRPWPACTRSSPHGHALPDRPRHRRGTLSCGGRSPNARPGDVPPVVGARRRVRGRRPGRPATRQPAHLGRDRVLPGDTVGGGGACSLSRLLGASRASAMDRLRAAREVVRRWRRRGRGAGDALGAGALLDRGAGVARERRSPRGGQGCAASRTAPGHAVVRAHGRAVSGRHARQSGARRRARAFRSGFRSATSR